MTSVSARNLANKAKVYRLLFKAAAEALTTIAADRKHLGAEIGVIAVLRFDRTTPRQISRRRRGYRDALPTSQFTAPSLSYRF